MKRREFLNKIKGVFTVVASTPFWSLAEGGRKKDCIGELGSMHGFDIKFPAEPSIYASKVNCSKEIFLTDIDLMVNRIEYQLLESIKDELENSIVHGYENE